MKTDQYTTAPPTSIGCELKHPDLIQGSFIHQQMAGRVVFGRGHLQRLPLEVELLGANRPMLLSTTGQSSLGRAAADVLGEVCVGLYTGAKMHVPIPTITEALQRATELKADCLVAIGGGSTVGLAKAMAVSSGLPIIAVPTTYAGSEVTPVYGITRDEEKITGKDFRVLPKTVIYDVDLTVSLPLSISVASGVNAIAHAAEGLYAKSLSPVTAMIAEEGIRAIVSGLKGLMNNSQDIAARSQCQYGAWLCGMVLATTEMGLHHKLCHTLGGLFGLPHAQMHTVILPHVLAYNAPAVPLAMGSISRALGVGSDPDAALPALRDFLGFVGADMTLAGLGMKESWIERAAVAATARPYPNPRPIDVAAVRGILKGAYFGNPSC